MSRWDSLRPSQDDQKWARRSERHAVGSEKKALLGSRLKKQSRSSALSFQSHIHHISENGESHKSYHQSHRGRVRLRPTSSLSSEIDDLQQRIPALQDRISLYKQQQQQQQHAISMDNQTILLIKNDIQEIKDVATTNEKCYRDIFQVLVDLLEIHNKDDELTHVLLLTMETKLRFADDQNIHITMTKEDAVRAVKHLSVMCLQQFAGTTVTKFDVPTSPLQCLALLVKSQLEILPSEDTAQSVVMTIFLPYLEQQQQQQQQLGPTGYKYHMSNIHVICQTLVILLQHQRHASSILAPLVQDIVLEDGMERTFENPIRTKLLKVMSQLLGKVTTEKQSYAWAASSDICSVVTAAIEFIRTLHQSSIAMVAEGNYLVDELKPFLFSVLQRSPTSKAELSIRNSSMHLLRGLLACYPNSMTLVGWKVLVEDYQKFLPLFLAPFSSDGWDVHGLSALSVDVLADFIFALPWKRWLNRETLHKQSNTSGLFRKVATAIESLFLMVQNAFQDTKTTLRCCPYVRLFKALFTEIPYCDDRTTVASIVLYQSLANVICDPTSSEIKLQIASEALIQSSGGNTTPSGDKVGMCVSGRQWLLEHIEISGPFVDRLYGSVASQDHGRKMSFRLLVALLRTLPDVAIIRWGSFCNLLKKELCSTSSQCDDNVIIFLKILEAFMLGRKDFSTLRHSGKNVSGLACSVLNSSVKFDSTAVHRCILAIYASFLSQDWREMAEENQLDFHFRRINMYCHHPDCKLRELACKSIAELCTQTVGSTESKCSTMRWEEKINCKEICDQLLRCCGDSNSAVRAMSIFALGNLADAIRMSQMHHLLDEGTLRCLLCTLLETIHDSNDKVTSNTIRCVGHAGFIFSKAAGTASTEIVRHVVAYLTEKLSTALTVALNNEAAATLPWKQRSRAKKHGWGACHSLGQIFQALPNKCEEEASLLAECLHAFQSLVICLDNHDTLNVKIVMAAMEAICNFPSDWTIYLTQSKEIVGTALTNAILLLSMSGDRNYHKSRPGRIFVAENLVERNESLLRYLLRISSISDAKHVLTDERISSKELSLLYHWLVAQDHYQVHANAFEIFALGLSSLSRWSDGVALEQNFASRAVQMYKYAEQTTHSSTYNADLGEEDVDEL